MMTRKEPRVQFRGEDVKMLDRLNAVYDRLRGPILLLLPLFTIVPAFFALLAVMGFGPIPTPRAAMARIEVKQVEADARVMGLEMRVTEHILDAAQDHERTDAVIRALQIDLCDRHRGNTLLLAQMDLDCDNLLRGRR